MCIHISIDKKKAKQFWELFNPTTNNWMVWLATASFSAFIYASLSSIDGGDSMNEIQQTMIFVIAMCFLIVTVVASVVLVYLVYVWLKSIIKIRRRKGERLESTTKNK